MNPKSKPSRSRHEKSIEKHNEKAENLSKSQGKSSGSIGGVLNDKVPTSATQELGIRHQTEARA